MIMACSGKSLYLGRLIYSQDHVAPRESKLIPQVVGIKRDLNYYSGDSLM